MYSQIPATKRYSDKGKELDDQEEKTQNGSPAETGHLMFGDKLVNLDSLPPAHLIKQVMACCHSATEIECTLCPLFY